MKNSTKTIVLTKTGEINKSVSNMILNCRFDGFKIRTGYYSGSGRFTSAHSAMPLIKSILDAQGYKYATGNDAPKGGITGDYVKVSSVAMNFIKNLISKP